MKIYHYIVALLSLPRLCKWMVNCVFVYLSYTLEWNSRLQNFQEYVMVKSYSCICLMTRKYCFFLYKMVCGMSLNCQYKFGFNIKLATGLCPCNLYMICLFWRTNSILHKTVMWFEIIHMLVARKSCSQTCTYLFLAFSICRYWNHYPWNYPQYA